MMSHKTPGRVGLLSIGLPYFDIGTALIHLEKTRQFLQESWQIVGPQEVITSLASLEEAIAVFRYDQPVDLVILQLGTFPDGEFPLLVAEKLQIPVILHSLPEPDLQQNIDLNSLCGANLATYSLFTIGHPHTFVHGDPADPVLQNELSARVRAGLGLASLRGLRIGLIGFHAPGFLPCVFDELLLRRKLGISLDYIDLGQIKDAFHQGAHKKAPHDQFPAQDGGFLSAESVHWMERYYGALTEVIEKSGKVLFAIRDWPELLDIDAPGSIWPALGWLLDDGYLLAPEGDVNAAVTMMLAHLLGESVPFFTDISAWDEKLSALLLWHYGGAPSLARAREEIRFGPEGRQVEFTLKPGTATLLRIGMLNNQFRILAVHTRVLDMPAATRRTGAWVQTIDTPAADVVHKILDCGWEHHFCLIHGDIRTELKAFSKLSAIPLEVL